MSNNEYHRQIAMAYHNSKTIQCRPCRSRSGSDWTDLDRRPLFNPQYEYRIKPEETNMKPHKHAELIKAWADGAEIQYLDCGHWYSSDNIVWDENCRYRIKPEPKPDSQTFLTRTNSGGWIETSYGCFVGNPVEGFLVTRDGETGKLKSAEVL